MDKRELASSNINENIVDFLNVSPFVRYVQHQVNANVSNYYIPWRYIYDYELLFVLEGTMTVIQEDQCYELLPGDVHVMSPMIKHRREIPEESFCNYYSIHFDFLYMGMENDFSPEEAYLAYCNRKQEIAPLDERLSSRPLCMLGEIELPQKQKVRDVAKYIQTLEKMNAVFAQQGFAYEIDLKIGMLTLFKMILQDMRSQFLSNNATEHDDEVASIIQYLYDNMDKPITFRTICRLFGYSESVLRKLFKEKTGRSPNEFLIDIRIERAIELLSSNKYTVAQVADKVGYSDRHYFSRLFRQKKGVAPGSLIHRGGSKKT